MLVSEALCGVFGLVYSLGCQSLTEHSGRIASCTIKRRTFVLQILCIVDSNVHSYAKY